MYANMETQKIYSETVKTRCYSENNNSQIFIDVKCKTDQPTIKPANRPTDGRAHWKVTLPIRDIEIFKIPIETTLSVPSDSFLQL